MSKNDLHALAQADTPAAVHVPNSTYGLVMWAVGRFGGVGILAALAVYATFRLYDDMRGLTREVMQTLSENTRTMQELRGAIDSLRDEADNAHKKNQASR